MSWWKYVCKIQSFDICRYLITNILCTSRDPISGMITSTKLMFSPLLVSFFVCQQHYDNVWTDCRANFMRIYTLRKEVITIISMCWLPTWHRILFFSRVCIGGGWQSVSVSTITETNRNGFSWNVHDRSYMPQGVIANIVICFPFVCSQCLLWANFHENVMKSRAWYKKQISLWV